MERNSSWLCLRWQLSYVSSELQREALRKIAEKGHWSRKRHDSAVKNQNSHQTCQSIFTKLSCWLHGSTPNTAGLVRPNWNWALFLSPTELPHSVIRSQIRLSYLDYSVSTLGQESLSTEGPVQTSHARVIPPLCENKQKLKALVGERNCVNRNE